MDDEEHISKLQNFLKELKSVSQSVEEKSNDIYCVNKNNGSKTTCIERNGKLETLQRILQHNEECHSLLSSLETSLSFLLEDCLKEERIVSEEIDAYENKRFVDNKFSSRCKSFLIRKFCRSPYFKDSYGFPSQYNEAVSHRRNMGYLDPWDILKKSAWTDSQKRSLENSIKCMNMERKKKQNVSYPENVSPGELDPVNSVLERKYSCTVNPKDEYDWIKISVVDLNSVRTPDECRAIWFNYLHPAINKRRWTERESKSLKHFVEQFHYQDWENVALQLGTNRSAYQCIGHFKIRLADFSKIEWTENDAQLLQKLVSRFRIGNFIPWYKIAWIMDGHVTSDVYRKWMKMYGNLKKGTFSLEEDILLVTGLREFGEDYSRISEYLPLRTNIQVRARVVVLRGRERGFTPWTLEEDQLLEELVEKYGFGNWSKISNHFLCRNNVQVRIRYRSLSQQKKKAVRASTKSIDYRSSKTYNYQRRLQGLWEQAQIVMKKKNIDLKESNSQVNMMYNLSQILATRKKVGRKKGSVNCCPHSRKEYYTFFHVAPSQRGGRGKDTYVTEKIPGFVQQIILGLQLLDGQIDLPTDVELICKDTNMLEMDKCALKFLIERKESVPGDCKFITFQDVSNIQKETSGSLTPIASSSVNSEPGEGIQIYPNVDLVYKDLLEADKCALKILFDSNGGIKEYCKFISFQDACITLDETSSTLLSIPSSSVNSEPQENVQFYPLCSPSASTMIGLRTMILNRLNIKEQSRGFTAIKPDSLSPVVLEEKSSDCAAACELWNKRLRILFTWTAIVSKLFPPNEILCYPAMAMNEISTEDVKGKSAKRKRGKKNALENPESAKPKRAYVKSGKYALVKQISGTSRRSTRNMKMDQDIKCE